jgi:hypothetical protein
MTHCLTVGSRQSNSMYDTLSVWLLGLDRVIRCMTHCLFGCWSRQSDLNLFPSFGRGCWGDRLEQNMNIKFLQIRHRFRITTFYVDVTNLKKSTFSAPNNLLNSLLKSCTRALVLRSDQGVPISSECALECKCTYVSV